MALSLEVDHARRDAIRRNHSATHLLHEALRQVLGDHVAQKGSLVAPDRLRFDFSHPKPMTAEELEKVEDLANDYVLQNSPVTTRLMALDDARASGARALFGEKYGDEVRVVAMGENRRSRRQFARLVGRAVRRHPCPQDRRHRRHLGCVGCGRRRRRAPHRGADRRPGAQGIEPRDGAGARGVVRAEGVAGGFAGPDRRPARRAQEAGARAHRRQEEAGDGRRRGGVRRRRCRDGERRQGDGEEARRRRRQGPAQPRRRGQEEARLRRRHPAHHRRRAEGEPGGRRDRRPQGLPTAPCNWSRPASPSSAARAAAGGPTWRRAAARTAPRPTRPSPRSRSW